MMNFKSIGTVFGTLSLIAMGAGCNKLSRIENSVTPDPTIGRTGTGSATPGDCSNIYVLNQTDVYGKFSGQSTYNGDFNDAILNVQFTYNVFDTAHNTDTYGVADPNTGMVTNVTYPSNSDNLTGISEFYNNTAFGNTYEMDLLYNPNWTPATGTMTYHGPLLFQVVSPTGKAKSNQITYNITPNLSTGEGYCGTMVTYSVANGGREAHTTPSTPGTLVATVYNVKADVMGLMNVSDAQMASDSNLSKKVHAEVARRMRALKTIMFESLSDKLEAAKKVTYAEYSAQKSRPDTTRREAFVKASVAVQAKQANVYSENLQKAMDEMTRQIR